MAGRTSRKRNDDERPLEDVCDSFLATKEWLNDSGEIAPRTFADYFATCGRLLDFFGKDRIVIPEEITPDDFGKYRAELAKTRGPVTLGNEIVRVRMVFKFAEDEGMIPKRIRFGQSFSKPSKKVYMQAKAAAGPKMFSAEELRAILKSTETDSPLLHATVLLGINSAFGQNDISVVPKTAFDLKKGWVRFPRPKTGVPRRAKLWPETVAALKAAFESRPEPKDRAHTGLAFLTPNGRPIIRHIEAAIDPEAKGGTVLWRSHADYLGRVFGERLEQLGITGRRGFYGLRHTFQTVADNKCRDEAAVKHIMGHTDDTISARYRDHYEDDRLAAVAATVREWLFANAPG